MPYGGGLVGLALLGLWIYCIFDVIATEEALVRNLPKLLWLVLVIIVPDVGAIALAHPRSPAARGLQTGRQQLPASSRWLSQPASVRQSPGPRPRGFP
jgi:Phospholipase_D-nuclease N-terminal